MKILILLYSFIFCSTLLANQEVFLDPNGKTYWIGSNLVAKVDKDGTVTTFTKGAYNRFVAPENRDRSSYTIVTDLGKKLSIRHTLDYQFLKSKSGWKPVKDGDFSFLGCSSGSNCSAIYNFYNEQIRGFNIRIGQPENEYTKSFIESYPGFRAPSELENRVYGNYIPRSWASTYLIDHNFKIAVARRQIRCSTRRGCPISIRYQGRYIDANLKFTGSMIRRNIYPVIHRPFGKLWFYHEFYDRKLRRTRSQLLKLASFDLAKKELRTKVIFETENLKSGSFFRPAEFFNHHLYRYRNNAMHVTDLVKKSTKLLTNNCRRPRSVSAITTTYAKPINGVWLGCHDRVLFARGAHLVRSYPFGFHARELKIDAFSGSHAVVRTHNNQYHAIFGDTTHTIKTDPQAINPYYSTRIWKEKSKYCLMSDQNTPEVDSYVACLENASWQTQLNHALIGKRVVSQQIGSNQWALKQTQDGIKLLRLSDKKRGSWESVFSLKSESLFYNFVPATGNRVAFYVDNEIFWQKNGEFEKFGDFEINSGYNLPAITENNLAVHFCKSGGYNAMCLKNRKGVILHKYDLGRGFYGFTMAGKNKVIILSGTSPSTSASIALYEVHGKELVNLGDKHPQLNFEDRTVYLLPHTTGTGGFVFFAYESGDNLRREIVTILENDVSKSWSKPSLTGIPFSYINPPTPSFGFEQIKLDNEDGTWIGDRYQVHDGMGVWKIPFQDHSTFQTRFNGRINHASYFNKKMYLATDIGIFGCQQPMKVTKKTITFPADKTCQRVKMNRFARKIFKIGETIVAQYGNYIFRGANLKSMQKIPQSFFAEKLYNNQDGTISWLIRTRLYTYDLASEQINSVDITDIGRINGTSGGYLCTSEGIFRNTDLSSPVAETVGRCDTVSSSRNQTFAVQGKTIFKCSENSCTKFANLPRIYLPRDHFTVYHDRKGKLKMQMIIGRQLYSFDKKSKLFHKQTPTSGLAPLISSAVNSFEEGIIAMSSGDALILPSTIDKHTRLLRIY